MKRPGADISEAMLPASRNNERLSATKDDVRVIDPHFGFTGNYGKHFLDRVPMCGRTRSRR